MEFTSKYNDLMYGALDVFLEHDSPLIIGRELDRIEFSTRLGNHGIIEKNQTGNWDIIVNGSVVYTIENFIFEVINRKEMALEIDDFLEELSTIYEKDLDDKSKILIESIVQGIAYLIMNGIVKSSLDLQFGPHFIKSSAES
jgi:hypothetical protein